MRENLAIGLVHIYTGDGKGKSTAALGQVLRALGYGLRAYIVQFLKSDELFSGEIKSLAQFHDSARLVRYHQIHPLFNPEVDENQLRASISEALNEAQKAMLSADYDIVVLDEINNAVADGFVEVETIAEFISSKPEKVELILTGRSAAQEIMKMADYVTEMRCIKHPFQRGIHARSGIEF
ncbi:cob(I)yrinic acid a,c-diamide adenosyltransferase [Candidatus Poribacteria bacterium]